MIVSDAIRVAVIPDFTAYSAHGWGPFQAGRAVRPGTLRTGVGKRAFTDSHPHSFQKRLDLSVCVERSEWLNEWINDQEIKDQSNENRIKYVFTDENMNYFNGSDSIKLLKNLEKMNKIKKLPKFVSVSAEDDEAFKENLIKLGFSFLLPKNPSTKDIKDLL